MNNAVSPPIFQVRRTTTNIRYLPFFVSIWETELSREKGPNLRKEGGDHIPKVPVPKNLRFQTLGPKRFFPSPFSDTLVFGMSGGETE